MKISEKMQSIINKQINHELFASYLYLSMAAYFDSLSLNGFSTWMKLQSAEENGHAMRLYDYLNDRGGRIMLASLESPKSNWDSPLEAFSDALKHEMKVTQLIHGMVEAARQEKDLATESFLKWFVDEQVEEEATANEIVEKIKMAGDHKGVYS